jgi:hypothetical protein
MTTLENVAKGAGVDRGKQRIPRVAIARHIAVDERDPDEKRRWKTAKTPPCGARKNALGRSMRVCAFENWPGRLEPRKSPQLYNLLADPFETTDRAAQDPTVVAEYLAGADAALDLANVPADLRVVAP